MNHETKRIRTGFLIFLLLLIQLIPTVALADTDAEDEASKHVSTVGLIPMDAPLHGHEIQITSPWGWRWDGSEYHHGIDIGADDYEPVYAAADGNVERAKTGDGYVAYVLIDHGNGMETLYGDLDYYKGLAVSATQNVTRGQLIGYVSPAADYGRDIGFTTGSHLHFEVWLNNTRIRPCLYAPFAPWLPQDADKEAFKRAQSHSMIWDAAFNFTEQVKKSIDTIAKACAKGTDLIKGTIKYVIGILMTIDLALTYILLSVDTEKTRSPQYSMFKVLVLRMILYLVLFFVITKWGPYIANGSRDLFLSLGAMTSGVDVQTAGKDVADPMGIVTRGAQIIEPLFTLLNETDAGKGEWLLKVVNGLIAAVFLIIIFGCLCIIAFQIALAYLEFYVTLLFSFANFMLAGLKQTRRYAAEGMTAIFAVSIKLFFFCFFSVMVQAAMSSIVVGDLITEVEDVITLPSGELSINSSDVSLEDFAEAVIQTESSGNPFIYNKQGSGAFGLFQQMPQFWNGRCQEYAEAHNIDPEEYKEKSWQNCPQEPPEVPTSHSAGDFGWNPVVQREVSLYEMQQFLDNGRGPYPPGDYRAVAEGWNPGAGGEYYQKILSHLKELHRKRHILQIVTCLKLTVVVVMFLFMGDKLSSLIIKQFGGKNGFKFTNNV